MSFATKVQQANNILAVLQTIEGQIQGIEVEQIGLEKADSDILMVRGEEPITYGTRKAELRAQLGRVEAEAAEYAEIIDGLLAMQEKQEMKRIGLGDGEG